MLVGSLVPLQASLIAGVYHIQRRPAIAAVGRDGVFVDNICSLRIAGAAVALPGKSLVAENTDSVIFYPVN